VVLLELVELVVLVVVPLLRRKQRLV